MKKKYKRILAGAVVAVALICILVSMGRSVQVDMEEVTRGDMSSEFTEKGTLVPVHSLILNAESMGTVEQLPFVVGERLNAGDVIVKMGYGSQTDLELQREQCRQQLSTARQTYEQLYGVNGTARAAEEAAKGEYELAARNYEGGKALGDAISAVELEALKNQKNQAYAAFIHAQEENSENSRNYYLELIKSYENQLATLETTVNPGDVTMPFDGILWENYVEAGSLVAVNQPVAKVYQEGDMKIQASLLTEDAMKLEVGQAVSCQFDDGSVTEAVIIHISPVAGQTLSSVGIEENRCQVELSVSEIPEGVGAGYQVDLDFQVVTATDVLSVPTTALVAIDQGYGVYVAEHGKAVLKPVATGVKSGGRMEVKEGLEEGMKVLVDPYEEDVKKGTRVK